MAWIEKRRCNDGEISARVKWRLGGTRGGAMQLEVFSAGTDTQNLSRAYGFKAMADPLQAPPRFVDIGEA